MANVQPFRERAQRQACRVLANELSSANCMARPSHWGEVGSASQCAHKCLQGRGHTGSCEGGA